MRVADESIIVVFIKLSRFTLQLIDKAFDLALHGTADIVKTHASKSNVQSLFKMQVTHLDRCRHGTKGQGRVKAFIHLTQLHALADIPFKAQLAACGGDVQQFAFDWGFELLTRHFDIDQIGQPQRRAKGVSALVINHFARECTAIAAMTVDVIDGQ